jgi:hypothetical protein
LLVIITQCHKEFDELFRGTCRTSANLFFFFLRSGGIPQSSANLTELQLRCCVMQYFCDPFQILRQNFHETGKNNDPGRLKASDLPIRIMNPSRETTPLMRNARYTVAISVGRTAALMNKVLLVGEPA